jgi:outer membrane receptor for ferrienterochelin and colicins
MKKDSLKRILLQAACATALMHIPLHAHAQSIDYASLETLFGEPVTTSATGKPQRVSEAPIAMDIVTQDDIRRSGAKDIAEVLRGLSGVNVLQSTRQQYDVNIRGYNQPYSPNLLVLVNGRQVYLDDYGYTVWATIPVQLSEIRQIEVVKGPNTALFGFNAADGVINIVTVNPLYDDVSNYGVTGGTDRYRDAHYMQTAKFLDNKIGVRLSAGASKADEFEGAVNGIDPHTVFTSPEKHSVNLDSIWQVTEKSQFRLEASHSKVQQTEMTPFDFLTKVEDETESVKGSYTADTPAGLIEATVYKNWLDTNFQGDIYAPTQTGDVRNNVIVSQVGDTFKVGVSHTFRIQGEYRHNFANDLIIGPAGSSVQDDVWSMSGMWEWAMNKDWTWTNSARVDRLQLAHKGPMAVGSPLTDADFDQNITKPSYNSGLVWKATPDDTFRINTARGLRMASFFDFALSLSAGATIGPFPVMQVGNPDIEPTTITSYELAWDRKIHALDGGFKANVFATRTQHVLGGNNTVCLPVGLGGGGCPGNPNLVVTQGGNNGSTKSWGAETGLYGKIGTNWAWGVNNTVQKIYDDYTDTTSNTKDLTPVDIASAHLGYTNGDWEVDTFLYYNTPYKQSEPGANIAVPSPLVRVPGHFSTSARIGYNINPKTTLSLSGQELQAAHSTTSRAPDVERRVFLSLDRSF